MKKAVILGGGITGLRIAKELVNEGYDTTVIEKDSKIGGMTASFKYKDFILDYGPHKFYTQLPGINEEFKEIVGEENYLSVEKKNSVRMLNKYFNFPVKLSQLMFNINPILASEIMIGFIKEHFVKRSIVSYEDYFVNGFGKKGYNLLFKDLAEKVWGDPKRMSAELARKRSPVGSALDIIKTALVKDNKNVSAKYFYYPKKGKGVICENLASAIIAKGGRIILNAEPSEIKLERGAVKSVKIKNKNKTFLCDFLVSTISIKDLPSLIIPKISKGAFEAAEKLEYRALIISFVFLKKERALKDNWIFFPEKEFCFNRVAEQKSFSPFTGPKDKTVITAELPCDPDSDIFNAPDDFIKPIIVKDLEKAGIVKSKEIYDFFTRRIDRVYPIYEIGYKDNLNSVLGELDKIGGLFSIGRLGLFNYNNVDHCIDMAKVISEIIIGEKGVEEWKKARQYFDSYRIVD